MRQVMLAGLLGSMVTGCAGFNSLERGDWVLAWSDEVVQNQMVAGTSIEVVKPAPGARQEVIPLERYESELTEGKRRKVGGTFNTTPRLATDITEPIEMMLGEVRELRIDEAHPAQVFLAGGAVRAYWTKVATLDEWKNNQPAERKESLLYLLADETGNAKVKIVVEGQQPHLIEVQVHEK